MGCELRATSHNLVPDPYSLPPITSVPSVPLRPSPSLSVPYSLAKIVLAWIVRQGLERRMTISKNYLSDY